MRDSRIIDNVPLVANDNKDALVKVLEERRREMPMPVSYTHLDVYKRQAEELHISVNTLKTHLTRALRQLRKEYNLHALFY